MVAECDSALTIPVPAISPLIVARSNEKVEVNSGAPLINPENANTTTLNTSALEALPNPGGDLTYPVFT